MCFFPLKKINGIYGYKTVTSMASQKNWDIAQKYSAQLMILFGGILSIISFLLELLNVDKKTATSLSFLLIALLLILLFYEVERKLKKQ